MTYIKTLVLSIVLSIVSTGYSDILYWVADDVDGFYGAGYYSSYMSSEQKAAVAEGTGYMTIALKDSSGKIFDHMLMECSDNTLIDGTLPENRHGYYYEYQKGYNELNTENRFNPPDPYDPPMQRTFEAIGLQGVPIDLIPSSKSFIGNEGSFYFELLFQQLNLETFEFGDAVSLAQTGLLTSEQLEEFIMTEARYTFPEHLHMSYYPVYFGSTPEPSTGLLILVGMSVLMLRRRQISMS